MSLKIPDIKKTLPCLRCGANTDQLLKATEAGAGWHCAACDGVMPAFTHAQMQEIVIRKLFKVPPTPTKVDAVPEGMRVFLEYHGGNTGGDTVGEKEASTESVLEHARITGHWPEVGKPLFAAPGAITKTVAMAIPYGKVVRVEGAPSAGPAS